MNEKLAKKIISITRKLKEVPNGRNRHFSFIVHRNRILSVGWNDYWNSHPACQKLGYRFSAIHSEFSAINRYRGEKKKLKKCVLINTRVNRFGEIGMSKPCEHCLELLSQINFRKVWYTNPDGIFEKL
jgi:deoxycytidylate deaminase